jgi:hypothetical protein
MEKLYGDKDWGQSDGINILFLKFIFRFLNKNLDFFSALNFYAEVPATHTH